MNADPSPVVPGGSASPALARLPVLTLLTLAALVAAAPAAEDKKETSKPKAARIVPRLLVPPVASGNTRITWRNGEELRGELDSAGAGVVGWKTSLFTEPMRIRQEAVRRVDFSTGFQRAEGSFRLALTDGSHLTGEVLKVDDAAITFKSAACGEIVVKRDTVVTLERIAGDGVIAAGPGALIPEKGSSRNSDGNVYNPLFLAAGGRTASPGFNQISQRTLDLPEKAIADLLIRSESIPDFKFILATGKETVSLETWGDELVIVQGDRFVSAGQRFKEEDRAAHIRLAWDRTEGRAAVYGGDGKLWAELKPEKAPEPEAKKVPAKSAGSWLERIFGGEEPVREDATPRPAKAAKGVTLHNKGSGIIVERFSITDWNGAAPPAIPADGAMVETAGEIIPGEPAAINGDNLEIRTSGGETRAVPLAQVRAIRWPRAIQSERDTTHADLWFSDGNLLRGKTGPVADDRISVETAFSATPVSAALARGRALVLAEPDKKEEPVALTKLDTIRAGDTALHGTIEPQGGELPHFRPVGGEAPLTPSKATDLTITRSLSPDEKFERAPALLHVKSKETIPVTLQNVSRDKVEFTWDAAETHSLETAQLHAIQFTAPVVDGKGFDGAGWRSLTEDGKGISRKGDAVVLQPGAGIAHPWILQGGDINFRMAAEGGPGISTIRIRLFCQGTERNSNSVNLLVGDFGGEIYCGLERGEGQLGSSTQVTSDGKAANIRISFPGDKVELWVNKTKVVSTTIAAGQAINGNANGLARIVLGAKVAGAAAAAPANKNNPNRSGTGMIIESASLWGNQQGAVKLMDLSMDTSPCMAGPPPFTDDARREALILPRLRREDPPRHVLIGRNGDLLRGEIEGMTTTHLAFRAGLENFKVPVDRVAAAVWLIAPPKPETPAPAAPKAPAPEKKEKKERADEISQPEIPELQFITVQEGSPVVEPPANPKPESSTPKEEKKPEKPRLGLQWLDLTNGGRISLQVEAWTADVITGTHPILGKCRIPRKLVHNLTLKEPAPPAALTALSGWQLTPTADPVIPEDSGDSSPLAGKSAPDFKLPMLEGDDFSLADNKGKVIVLDFWATWCGPCVKSLPGLIEAMAEFPPDDVAFIAVNQGESKDQVKKFLAARQWKMPVGFDADQKVGGKFGVEGIPHTVVIGRDGSVAFTKTGYEPDGDKKIAEAVKKALEAPAPPKKEPSEKAKEKKEQKDKPADEGEKPLLPKPKEV